MLHDSRLLAFGLAASLVACTSPFDDAYDAGLLDASRVDGATRDAAADTGADAPAIDGALPTPDGGIDGGTDAAIVVDAGNDAGNDAGHDAATVDAPVCATTSACGPSCVDCLAPGGLAHVTGATCTGSGACDYAACAMAFADCDGSRANGCEAAWSATRCGSGCTDCSTTVLHATPTCGGSGTCDYGTCSAGFVDCDAMRANGCERAQDATHCGASCTSCTAMVMHATGAACTAGGTCDYGACAAGFSDCNGNRADGCERAWAASTCGGACTNCTSSIMNATPVCSAGGACDYTVCTGTFRDCDANRANGCERAQDVNHCGSSCTNCATGFLHGTAGCPSGACTVASCTSGFANCNGMIGDGCETASAGTDLDCCQVSCNTPGGFTCQGSATSGFTCR